jgi:hypothetical protein
MEMEGRSLASCFALVGGASTKRTILEGFGHKEEVETHTRQTLTVSEPTRRLIADAPGRHYCHRDERLAENHKILPVFLRAFKRNGNRPESLSQSRFGKLFHRTCMWHARSSRRFTAILLVCIRSPQRVHHISLC